ncbi:circadian clock KaiB family protein [Methanoplanus endosymbiosus]|uniref:Circadian clock KaiB family protein n=1 Tax=Methanoplanus endosymbiosus TaxID=33865 RepID=A0A9E7PN32_9EURY|nr:circadian clock KaiB family protein [Methanoplanus endosymbiosus]UUX93278.1 circadian clock KaiB family protein [Methanoplanus endosymbiosus]
MDENSSDPDQATTRSFEEAIENIGKGNFILTLYITGQTPGSQRAIRNIKKICDEELQGRYELEIIDIYQQPELAKNAELVAAPTLVKTLPAPIRRLVGDMSDRERVLAGLGLKKKEIS